MKTCKLQLAVALAFVTTHASAAVPTVNAPEIGVAGGIAAAVGVGAVVAFIWERHKKR